MSHPQPPQRQPTDHEFIQYAKTLHNTAIITAVACPLIALLPPRKLDVYTFSLVGTSLFSANWLVRERTGRSVLQHLGIGNRPAITNVPIETMTPPSMQDHLTANRDFQDTVLDYQRLRTNLNSSVTADIRKQREAWKIQQAKEIQEEIDEGKGFGNMIMDQIWEVWHWRRRGDDDE